jgi:hypothetical protein
MKKVEPKHFIHPRFNIGWHNFKFTLPLSWEVTSYTMNPSNGLIGFANITGPLGQVTWRKVKEEPDVKKIMNEVHRRYLEDEKPDLEKTFSTMQFITVNDIHISWDCVGERFYASTYQAEKKLLIEWIFPSYSKEALAVVKTMLVTFKENLPFDDKIFFGGWGLEVFVPKGYELTKVMSLPAAVSMEFENKSHHRIIAHRWGLPEIIFENSNLTNFYHNFLYTKCRFSVKKVQDASFFNKEGTSIQFKTRGRWGFDFLLGPWWHGEASAFWNKDENRIYAVEHIAPGRSKNKYNVETLFGDKYYA